MSTAITLYDQPKSMAAVKDQRTAIANLMSAVMVKDIDYGTIPGTPKPTLYKAGSEKLLSMFHMAGKPVVDDLSTPDCMRFRVFFQVTSMATGAVIGEGVGEASSLETKYAWRAMVCQQEYDETPEERRRAIYKKGYQGNAPTRVLQVRTCMEDVANTILKMAKKRAQIDAVLTVTAASDVFMQDAQQVIDAGIDLPSYDTPAAEQRPATLQPKQQPVPQRQEPVPQRQEPTGANKDYGFTSAPSTITGQQVHPSAASGVAVVSEPQARRFYAIARGSGKENADIDSYLNTVVGVSRKEDIPRGILYDTACTWAGAK